MSRYNPAQLKKMATIVMVAKEQNDERYFQLIMNMSICTGFSVPYIEDRIQQMASN